MNVTKWTGQPISKPGFYSDVPMAAYHSGKLCAGGPSLSSSGLRLIVQKSESHFWDQWPLNPDHDPAADEESESLILGRAVHHLILGQPKFAAEYIVTPPEARDAKGKLQPWSLRLDSAKAWVAAQARAGKTVLTPSQVDRIKGMAFSLSKQKLVGAGALNGLIELTGAWRHESGIWLLIRPDVVPTDSADIVDLKTTTSVVFPDLVSAIGSYGYHQQGALVAEGFQAITGQPISSFSLYFVESKRPYCCRLVRLSDADLALGGKLNRVAIGRFVKAFNTNAWPGPGGDQDSEATISLSPRQREIAESTIKHAGEAA